MRHFSQIVYSIVAASSSRDRYVRQHAEKDSGQRLSSVMESARQNTEMIGKGWHSFSRLTMEICRASWLEVEHHITPGEKSCVIWVHLEKAKTEVQSFDMYLLCRSVYVCLILVTSKVFLFAVDNSSEKVQKVCFIAVITTFRSCGYVMTWQRIVLFHTKQIWLDGTQ